jgi:hypothetical protein
MFHSTLQCAINGINKIYKDSNVLWADKAIQEAAKIENVTNLKTAKIAAKNAVK